MRHEHTDLEPKLLFLKRCDMIVVDGDVVADVSFVDRSGAEGRWDIIAHGHLVSLSVLPQDFFDCCLTIPQAYQLAELLLGTETAVHEFENKMSSEIFLSAVSVDHASAVFQFEQQHVARRSPGYRVMLTRTSGSVVGALVLDVIAQSTLAAPTASTKPEPPA